jgi:16S rRNA (cytosine967-C5)-methyltransferase
LALLKPFQIAIAADLIRHYQFDQAFHLYFNQQARLNKNWGSKDRKLYRNLCYAFFRTGFKFPGKDLPKELEQAYAMVYGDVLENEINALEIFPYQSAISPSINFDKWSKSHLYQKPMFLVCRTNKIEDVRKSLTEQSMAFAEIQPGLLQLPADSKCDFITEKGWAWIQDAASAMACDVIEIEAGQTVWDACCGAGGKSIYLSNRWNSNFELTCSDMRYSILQNLKERFINLGLKLPKIELADLNEVFHISNKFDKIILDVPCSGSGTWGRSPEHLRGFTEDLPNRYSKIQRNIVKNALKNAKSGTEIYYLTCSVFVEENENNTHYFERDLGLKLLKESYHFTNHKESDTLYSAIFVKH